MAKKDRSNRGRLVRFKDAAHVLGVPIEALPRLVQLAGCPVLQDRWSAPCVSFNDFERLCEDPRVAEAAMRAALAEFQRRHNDRHSGANEIFANEIREKLSEYRSYIACLERIHLKYLPHIKPLQERNGLAAAYLLYARVINLLNMGCVCVEAGYWNAGIVLRQIDESIQAAEYFSSTESTGALQRDVVRWFRENRSPQPADIRKAIAARVGGLLGREQGERHLYVMSELYDIKSKWIHPTFSPVRETLHISSIEGQARVAGFDYGASTYPRKLHELTLFYRSSIWTAVQGFLMCFQHQIPLEAADAEELLSLNRKFDSEHDGL